MKDKACPKCGSTEIVEDGQIIDNDGEYGKLQLGVTVYANPDAWVFRGATTSTLTAWVCGACGFVELYVKSPQKLLEAFRKKNAQT